MTCRSPHARNKILPRNVEKIHVVCEWLSQKLSVWFPALGTLQVTTSLGKNALPGDIEADSSFLPDLAADTGAVGFCVFRKTVEESGTRLAIFVI